MLLVTKYIPFYFFTIFIIIVFVYCLLFFKQIPVIGSRLLQFLKNQKLFTAVCGVLLIFSLIPGILFFIESNRTSPGVDGRIESEIVLPQRSDGAPGMIAAGDAPGMMVVGFDTKTKWGIEEDLAFAYAHSDLRYYKFAVMYIPIFGLILLLFGMLTRLDKKMIYLFISGGILCLLFAHHFPFYEILHEYIFYFKYFRNLHFFLWMAILPIFILFVGTQLDSLLKIDVQSGKCKTIVFIIILSGHLLVLTLLYWQGDAIVSSYLSVTGSFFIFSLYIWRDTFRQSKSLFLLCALFVIAAQPLEVFYYFSRNADPFLRYHYRYGGEQPYWNFALNTGKRNKELFSSNHDSFNTPDFKIFESSPPSIYYGTRWHIYLSQNINKSSLGRYRDAKMMLYYHIRWVDDDAFNIKELGYALAQFKNIAYVAPLKEKGDHVSSKELKQFEGIENKTNGLVEIIADDSLRIKITDYGVNHIKFKTYLQQPKFLVYTDNYHSAWQAFINGKRVNLYRANFAFKGLLLPAGKNTVLLRYGSVQLYFLNYALFVCFYGAFFYLIYLFYRKYARKGALSRETVS